MRLISSSIVIKSLMVGVSLMSILLVSRSVNQDQFGDGFVVDGFGEFLRDISPIVPVFRINPDGFIFIVTDKNGDNKFDELYMDQAAMTGNKKLKFPRVYFERGENDEIIDPRFTTKTVALLPLKWNDFQRIFDEVHNYVRKNGYYDTPQNANDSWK